FCEFFNCLSHSRFNRRSRQLLQLIYQIRQEMNKKVDLKKIYFYGFKVHAIVSDDGYILDYVVTKASVHDARETVELLENTHPSNYYLLGDEGYLGKELHQQLKQMGYELWTSYRKNMTEAKKHNNHQLMAIRRTIESGFSLLTYYNAENNRARSL
ncbi:IS982 family transposase, partial [Lactobacillus amylovorus]